MRWPQLTPSPVVELNRAVAVVMAYGPAAGLALVDPLTEEPSLQRLSPAAERARRPAEKLGRHDEARAEFERAAALTGNVRERALLQSAPQFHAHRPELTASRTPAILQMKQTYPRGIHRRRSALRTDYPPPTLS